MRPLPPDLDHLASQFGRSDSFWHIINLNLILFPSHFTGAEGEAIQPEETVPQPVLPCGGKEEMARSSGCPGKSAQSLRHVPEV